MLSPLLILECHLIVGGREVFVSEEQADSSDAGCSGREALWRVGRVDSSEGEDGEFRGGLTGSAESFETGGWGDFGAIEPFSEDGGEEDERGLLVVGAADFVEGVAADADGGSGQDAAYLSRGELSGSGGEVNAIRAGSDRDIGATGDKDTSAGEGFAGVDCLKDAPGKRDQGGIGKVPLAHEDEGDVLLAEPGAPGEQSRGLPG